MYKILQKQIDNNIIKLSLITSLIYMLLFNSSIFINKFNHYNATAFKTILELGKDFIYIYIALFITFFGLTTHRLIFLSISLFLFFSGAIASYYIFISEALPQPEMIGKIFNVYLPRAYEFVSIKLIAWLIFCIFVYLYTIKNFKVADTNLFITKILSAACLLITVNFIFSPPNQLFKEYLPFYYLHDSYLYLNGSKQSLSKSMSQSTRNYLGLISS